MFDGEMTIAIDVDVLGKDAIWQEEELEFEDVEKPGEDEADNEDDEQQDIDDDSSENEKEATLNVAWKDSQRLMDAIVLLEQQR
ncbi:unnamed protein product [Sphagnum balticum]